MRGVASLKERQMPAKKKPAKRAKKLSKSKKLESTKTLDSASPKLFLKL
jgi:hypothetical protein